MKKKEDKSNEKKVEYMITVTMQFTHEFTDKEIDEGKEIPHEVVVTGCVELLANKDYSVQEDEMK